jgi:hypothetical protein
MNVKWSRLISRRRFHAATAGLLSALALSLGACTSSPFQAVAPVALPQGVELSGGDSGILNYTPGYIHKWALAGPAGSGIGGGGRNALPVNEDGRPYGGGGMCCTSYPREWQPDLRLTVRWLAFKEVKKLGRNAPGVWYKAENVRIAQYGKPTYGLWGIFLPGDRVRIMVADGNASGHNSVGQRPVDDDPYIAHGMPDDEWNELYPNGVARGIAR